MPKKILGLSLALVSSCVFAGQLQLTGFIDGSLNYLSRKNFFISGVQDRVYDLNENGGTLHQLAGTLEYLPDQGFGAAINAMAGRDAITTNADGMGTMLENNKFGLDLTQAYVQYSTGDLTISAGKMLALNGAETINPLTNSNYSRSYLFGFAGPFTLLAARASYQASNHLVLTAGVNNGWDTVRDRGRRETIEFQALMELTDYFTASVTFYNGGQRAIDRTINTPISTRDLIDIVTTLKATKQLTLILNFDWAGQKRVVLANGMLGRAHWRGAAGYINYQWNDDWQTSLRGEVFEDEGGARTGVNQTLEEITFTIGYLPARFNQKVGVRIEARHDFSNVQAFLSKSRLLPRSGMQSFGLEAYYNFS